VSPLSAIDPVAVLVVLAVGAAAVALGYAAFRYRARLRRWFKSVTAGKRLHVIRRDLDRMAEYIGRVHEADPAAWQPFEDGLAAMAECQWDQALQDCEAAQAKGGVGRLAPIPNQIGVCYYMQGRLADALQRFVESARIAKEHGDDQGRASALSNIGVVLHHCGEHTDALKHLREALSLSRQSANKAAEALYLSNIANVLHVMDRIDEALKLQNEALAIVRQTADQQGLVGCLCSIGSLLYDKGDTDQALANYSEAVATAHRIGYRLGEAVVLGNIGCLHREKGDLDQAMNYYEQALALARDVGYREGVATELGNIGLTHVSRGQLERAVLYLAQSLTFFLAAGVAHGPRQDLYGLSRCDDWLGRERLQDLLTATDIKAAAAADLLDRIDSIRTRRPWQRRRRQNPFAPVR
jgi:tetratricopeptide (TPR) repeat protein